MSHECVVDIILTLMLFLITWKWWQIIVLVYEEYLCMYILDVTYRIDYTQEWVMRLCNPRVCNYPKAKPRDKCKQVGYSA